VRIEEEIGKKGWVLDRRLGWPARGGTGWPGLA